MTREEFLRKRIASVGTFKDFAEKINMPYSTLLSILKNVGGASIDNIFKICNGLKISPDELSSMDSESLFPVSKDALISQLSVSYDLSELQHEALLKFLSMSRDDREAVSQAFLLISNLSHEKRTHLE